jgi:Cft2 family RNA processing exonuclease
MQDTMGILNSVASIDQIMPDAGNTALTGTVQAYSKIQKISTAGIDPGFLSGIPIRISLPAAVVGMEYIVVYDAGQNIGSTAVQLTANGSDTIYSGSSTGNITYAKNLGESIHIVCYASAKWSVVAHV